MNVASVLDGTARDAVALVHHADRISYGELADHVESIAAQLAEAGVDIGDRIALVCANTPTFVAAFLGVAHIGAVAVPLNPSSPAAEIARQLEAVAVVGIVVGPSAATNVCELDIAHFKVVLAPPGVALEGAQVLAAGGSRAEPGEERFPAAAMFAVITGFTPLTEFLARREPAGVEDLSRMLNSYFGEMIDLIQASGGDIVKFAGDALLAIWDARDEDLETATRRALQCGAEVKEKLNDRQVLDGVRLSLKIYIGAGDTMVAHVGGVDHASLAEV
ncbi:MAG: AMP-binding protein, partial [Acidobacteria bacterium]|nr:AMP-binding protein [Acidobacteriota bacterium]